MLDGTYAGLQASLAALLNRSDLTAAMPDWIVMAEAQLNRKFVQAGGIRQMVSRVSINWNAEFVSLPTDFRGVRSIYLTEDRTRPLKKISQSQLNSMKNNTITLTGKPGWFCIVGTMAQLFMAPDVSYPGEMTYLSAIPPLASNNDNWLITAHPDAYLYTAALQSAPYLKADPRLEMWGAIAEEISADIIAANVIEEDAPELDTYQQPGMTP